MTNQITRGRRETDRQRHRERDKERKTGRETERKNEKEILKEVKGKKGSRERERNRKEKERTESDETESERKRVRYRQTDRKRQKLREIIEEREIKKYTIRLSICALPKNILYKVRDGAGTVVPVVRMWSRSVEKRTATRSNLFYGNFKPNLCSML